MKPLFEEGIMRTRILNLVVVLCALLAGTILLISCGSDSSEGDKLSGDIREMVRYYQEMKELGLAGDVEAFLARRDSVTKDEVGRYFEGKGWVIDSTKVSNWCFNWPDVAGLPLVQDTGDGEWRRLLF